MFPKPPRPVPPGRAIPTHVVRQQERRRVPDVLVVDAPAPSATPAPLAGDTTVPVTER